jgi:hypothetical protein
LINRIIKLTVIPVCSGAAIKKGIEKRSVTIDIIYEKSSASKVNNDFFSARVEKAENNADKNASINQINVWVSSL